MSLDAARLGLVVRARPLAAGTCSALVPSDGAGRALAAVIAILGFLAALAAGAAEIAWSQAAAWRGSVVAEATVQVRPAPGRDLERDLRRVAEIALATPGIGAARALTAQEAAALVEPWLGAGLDLSGLPVPGLVVLRLASGARPDLQGLRTRLATEVPGTAVDDHAPWLRRLSAAATAIVAVALGVVGLVLAASGAAVAFATRGVVAGHRDVVDVLHVVGASDGFIAREFAAGFVRLGLAGGAVGASAAAVVLGLSGVLPWPLDGPGLDDMVGGLAPGWAGYLAMALVAPALAVISGAVSRRTVQRFLKHRA